MKGNKRITKILVVVTCCLLFIASGYAILSQTLGVGIIAKLTGVWKIYIDSITPVTNTTRAISTSAEVIDELNASFGVEFHEPGEYMEYDIVVKNGGTIDAVLDNIEMTITGRSDLVTMTTDLLKGTKLDVGKQTKFRVKIKYNDDATELPTDKTANYNMKLTYIQYEEGYKVTPDDTLCYVVTDTGVLADYDQSCGTDIVVPNSVNGIKVKQIGAYAFADANFDIYMNELTGDMIVFAEDEATKTNALNDADVSEVLSSASSYKIYVRSDLTPLEYGKLIPTNVNYMHIAAVVDSTGLVNEEMTDTYVTSLDLSQAKNLTIIQDNAFGFHESSCTTVSTLKSVTFGSDSKVTKLGHSMFACAELETLSIPRTVVDLGGDHNSGEAFNQTKVTNFTAYLNDYPHDYPFSDLEATNATILKGDISVAGSIGLDDCTNITFGEGITEISYLPYNFTSITIPSTITDLNKFNTAVLENTTTNKSVIMNHSIAPSFYNDTSWYNTEKVTVTWPNINS